MKHNLHFYISFFLTDTLLLGLALAWLLLVFIPILVCPGPGHYMGIWYDNSNVVLGIEVAICIFSIVWPVTRTISKIRLLRGQSYVRT